MKEKLEACFSRLQEMDIKPTLHNMELMLQTLYDLREIYQMLERMDDNGRVEADSE